jgi:signal transduction histidine kinase
MIVPRFWILVVMVLVLGVLTIAAPFTLYAPEHGDGVHLTEWRAIDGELLDPVHAPERFLGARQVATLPDFIAGQEGGDGAFGHVTYITRVRVPGEKMALVTGKVRSVYRYYALEEADGGRVIHALGGNGDPALPDAEDAAFGPPGAMRLPAGAGELWLVLHVSNSSHFQAGLLTEPVVRKFESAVRTHEGRLAAIMLYAGIFIAIGFYTILLALWHAGESYYYSGGFVLVLIALRLVLLQDFEWLFAPSLSYAVSLRLEYITFFAILPFFYALAYGLFPEDASSRGLQALVVVAVLFVLNAIFAPLELMIKTRNIYLFVAAVTGIMVLMAFLRARSRRRVGVDVALVGWLIMISAMVADAVVTTSGVVDGMESVPVAAVALAVILMWLFTLRYRREQAERTALSAHLAAANETLQIRARELDEAQRRATDALQVKSSFLANISHEVRTPLNAIIGFSDLLIAQSHSPIDGKKLREYLQLIRNNGQELLVLMTDILSVSDLEAGRFDVAHEAFDPEDVVTMSMNLVAPVAHEKHLFLDTQADSADIQGDIRILRQAVIKVLSNAVKYSPTHGVVTLRGAVHGDVYTIQVTDTGRGMSEEEITAVMSVFGRAGDAYTADGSGIGMSIGLPLVSKLLSLVGGRLEIESIPSVGTTVTISYPLN